jgi:hypothetical protein
VLKSDIPLIVWANLERHRRSPESNTRSPQCQISAAYPQLWIDFQSKHVIEILKDCKYGTAIRLFLLNFRFLFYNTGWSVVTISKLWKPSNLEQKGYNLLKNEITQGAAWGVNFGDAEKERLNFFDHRRWGCEGFANLIDRLRRVRHRKHALRARVHRSVRSGHFPGIFRHLGFAYGLSKAKVSLIT